MKNILPVLLLLALSGVPALAQNQGLNNNNQNNNNQQNNGERTRGAPGPIMGASLPVLLVAGGIYWLVRRRKRASAD